MNYVDYNRNISIRQFSLTSSDLIAAAEDTNEYIKNLVRIFGEIGFDIFYSLGQRNISGFIGEIYKNILANRHPELNPNPHPDGRPDLILLDSLEATNYLQECFCEMNGRYMPIKDLLTPFRFGGLEVKCSIGSSSKDQTERYISYHGHSFALYEPRVGYLNGITWWAHHSSASNLLGLYYDYYGPENGTPQVLAAMYSDLTEADWNAVSHGDPLHKKTSNTSLNKRGLLKMKRNCMFCVSDANYQQQMQRIGVLI